MMAAAITTAAATLQDQAEAAIIPAAAARMAAIIPDQARRVRRMAEARAARETTTTIPAETIMVAGNRQSGRKSGHRVIGRSENTFHHGGTETRSNIANGSEVMGFRGNGFR